MLGDDLREVVDGLSLFVFGERGQGDEQRFVRAQRSTSSRRIAPGRAGSEGCRALRGLMSNLGQQKARNEA